MSATIASRKKYFGSAMPLMTDLIKTMVVYTCSAGLQARRDADLKVRTTHQRLERPRDAAVFSDPPEVHGHQHGDAERQTNTVQDIKPQQRAFPDEGAAEQRKARIVGGVNQRHVT